MDIEACNEVSCRSCMLNVPVAQHIAILFLDVVLNAVCMATHRVIILPGMITQAAAPPESYGKELESTPEDYERQRLKFISELWQGLFDEVSSSR
jgi:hypothetical protein